MGVLMLPLVRVGIDGSGLNLGLNFFIWGNWRNIEGIQAAINLVALG